MKSLNFKISSALKNLIGKELITDEFIAVFELVKNSFDAYAKKVTVTFDNDDDENPIIVIRDDGKGMSHEDLINKWLFVAYSAKTDGSEDTDDSKDYRDKIESVRIFAGAKGVGRFSCDRLGNNLKLITKKRGKRLETIEVDWDKFEKNPKDQFVKIKVQHDQPRNDSFNLTHGTILEIRGLRDNWDRERILKLKRSLEKLINPKQQENVRDFEIKIIVPREKAADEKEKDLRKKVNGNIENALFETLGLKTTQIVTEVTSDGQFVYTTLIDRGTTIYRIKETNTYPLLHDIKVYLFQLNRAAKVNFKKKMGIDAVKFGSMFLYKNGFRVYPFGEEGEDLLGIDRRKQQGVNRFLGTRDIIGRIEINGKNDNLKETTSRDGGLIKTPTYNQLEDLFFAACLKRLERYAIDTIKWGDPITTPDPDSPLPALNPEDVKAQILEVIANLTKSENVLDIDYDRDFLKTIEASQEKSVGKLLKNFSVIMEKTDNPALLKDVQKVQKQLEVLREAKIEAEEEVEAKTSQNLFLKSVSSVDTKELIALQHQIGHSTHKIKIYLEDIASAVGRTASKETINSLIALVSLENEKIATISQFASKAKFNLLSKTITKDLVGFIKEYVQNVYVKYKRLTINNKQLEVRVEIPDGLKFKLEFRPLEIIIVLDNLLNNAVKAGAKRATIKFERNEKTGHLEIMISDNGRGITENNISKIFDFGFSTTDGSGLGLYHVNQIITKGMKGTIKVNNKYEHGAEFIIGLSK